MDKVTMKFWIDRAAAMERERDEWIEIARRIINPYHDGNCEYGAPCTYCDAAEKVNNLGRIAQ